MTHLKGIGFENFRVFENKAYFDFAPITILTGKNSSGKSSVLNGLRILSENFQRLARPQESTDGKTPGFDAILRKDFDISSIVERYGSLEQFLNYNSTTKEFIFSFKQMPDLLQDELEYHFVIGIEKNRLNTGRVKRIEITSLRENKVVFSINEHPGSQGIAAHHRMKIDLCYFYLQFDKLYDKTLAYYQSSAALDKALEECSTIEEVQEKINVHNHKYLDYKYIVDYEGSVRIINTYGNRARSVISKRETFKEIVEEVSTDSCLFDLSSLWQNNVSNIMDVTSRVINYYKESDSPFSQLTIDLLKTLSMVEWRAHFEDPFENDNYGVDHFLKFGNNDDDNRRAFFSLREFVFLFVDEGVYYVKDMPFTEEEIEEKVESAIERAGIKQSRFVEDVFKPIVKELAALPRTTFFDLQKEIKQERGVSKTEKYFYNVFLFNILELIRVPFNLIGSCSFIEAHRIQPKRLFSIIHQDLFSKQIKSLLKLSEYHFNRSIDFLTRWVRAFQIAQKIEIEKDNDSESFKVYLYRNENKRVLLADYGYGISQILPIILELIPYPNVSHMYDPTEPEYEPRLICIEEPENSLHPALQSKLAEMFAEAVKEFNTQLIIETHSEYLIRKLQYLTASKQSGLTPLSSQIFYFYHPDDIPEDESQVKKINIKSDGFLTEEFGEGFFDESGRLMIDLLKLQNQN